MEKVIVNRARHCTVGEVAAEMPAVVGKAFYEDRLIDGTALGSPQETRRGRSTQ
jgi:hypothetical protein